ncbi:MAG: GtrA family protein [Candidatus Staskawiczbacteria bacterium]|nr:GtrA family protein [Candidatus Staskawiczbacteria bacterium]
MKVVDILFALICGKAVAWLILDFLKEYGIDIGIYKWILSGFLPLFSLFCLWLAYLIGKKALFVFEAAKFVLVGAIATIIDLNLFELFNWGLSFFILEETAMASKGISFIMATGAKYWGNKYWCFEKSAKENPVKEGVKFFAVTLIGLALDMGFFFYFTKVLGPQFGTPSDVWIKFSVIFAALGAAAWNFSGYKFLVFKK